MTKDVQKILIVGNLVIDRNLTETGERVGPGGSSFFCARILELLGVSPFVVSPYGRDYPKKILKDTEYYPDKPVTEKSFVFKNIIRGNGTRLQMTENFSGSSYDLIGSVPDHFISGAQAVITAPLIPNISLDYIRRLREANPRALMTLLPQGYLRSIAGNGRIKKEKWSGIDAAAGMSDLIVLSEKDWDGTDELATKWSGTGSIVIITKESRGCSVYSSGKRDDIGAFVIRDIVDSTGAGDIFAASFVFYYLKKRNIFSSSVFANAAAGLSLRFPSDKIEYSYTDIINFIGKSGKEIIL